MQPVFGRRLLAWTITVVLAPPIFIVLLLVTTVVMAAVRDWANFVSWFSPSGVVRDLPDLGAVVVIAVLIALPPTIILGVPASIALHRLNIRSFVIYAVVGLILGAIGGALIMILVEAVEPLAFETPLNAVVALAFYGALVAVTYNLLERRTSQMA